jgi:hypothetical protein
MDVISHKTYTPSTVQVQLFGVSLEFLRELFDLSVQYRVEIIAYCTVRHRKRSENLPLFLTRHFQVFVQVLVQVQVLRF